MKRRLLSDIPALFSSIAFFALLASQSSAAGFIVPTPRQGEAIPLLTVKYERATVEIMDQIAKTSIDQVYINNHTGDIEGTFIFPLPEDAVISDFAMYIGDKRLEGEILDRDQAKRIYEDIVRKMRDPAILEYMGQRIFRARVYPIFARSEKRITLTYSQFLKSEGNLIRYIYPLNAENFCLHPIGEFSISALVNAAVPISNIYSPSHRISAKRENDSMVRISFEAANMKPDRDFQLFYSRTKDDVGLTLITGEENDEHYFMLLASPSFADQKEKVIDKNLIIVLDSSGSMEGEKIEQAKQALGFIITHLDKEDRFTIIDFDDGIELFSPSLLPADKKNVEQAIRFMDRIEASGGTNINDALLEALEKIERTSRPNYLIFLTDGQPTTGVTAVEEIVKNVGQANEFASRIFVFGVGNDVNALLLDKLASENRGSPIYVGEKEDIESTLSTFYTRISSPILSDIEITFDAVDVKHMYPRTLPDLFKGTQIAVIGKYEGEGSFNVTLSGKVGDEERSFVLKGQKNAQEGSHQFLPRLWAMRRIGYLLEEIRFGGLNTELVDEVKRLAVKFGFVTPYTAFLVTENGPASSTVTVKGSRERDFSAIVGGVSNSSRSTAFSDSFTNDLPVAGREYQSVLSRASHVDPLTGQFMSDINPDAIEEIEIITGGTGAEYSRCQGGFAVIGRVLNESPKVSQSGATAVAISKSIQQIKSEERSVPDHAGTIKRIEGKSFYLKDRYWVDVEYKDGSAVKEIAFDSDEYYKLLSEKPGIVKYLSVGRNLIICFKSVIYRITDKGDSGQK